MASSYPKMITIRQLLNEQDGFSIETRICICIAILRNRAGYYDEWKK